MKVKVENSLFICHILFHIFSIDPIHIQETQYMKKKNNSGPF
jgi:hypothetical protein